MPSDKQQIGVFDSGLGGLSILKEFIRLLPRYNYVYLGDNARVPYGGRSDKIIYQYTTQALTYLFSCWNCRIVILACNTATSTSLKRIQQEFLPQKFPHRKVLGIIKPVIEVLPENRVAKIGIIGTRATINSRSFVREIRKVLPKTKIVQQAAPLLVPFIEEGAVNSVGFSSILTQYLQVFKKESIDQLILGCTHYGLIHQKIKNELGKSIKVIAEGKIAAQKLAEYLCKHPELENQLAKTGRHQYCLTDLTARYQKLFIYFLGKQFKNGNELLLVNLN
jgi:glutamate racemase